MQEAIQSAIERQAKKLLERQKRQKFSKLKYRRRFKLRTGETPLPGRKDEEPLIVWSMHPHFDPIYCIKHSKFLAKVIWKKIQRREYKVTPAILYKIPKDSGGHREIMVFSIPDSAVANLFNQKLRDRNKNLQSPFCYSYRKDRTIFDAVLQTSSLLKDDKVYVVQYDFSKYFDSINHDYLKFVIKNDGFYISPAEEFIIDKFLKHQYAEAHDYKLKKYKERERGVPQGCSLSLFLSNIAGHELDKQLEKSNGMFVRFADDVVCTSRHFEDALKIAEAFKDHCYYSGISINFDKSPGICLLKGLGTFDEREHFVDGADIGKLKTIPDFDYIGHKFSREHVKISDKGIKRIKANISRIIYAHLLKNPKKDLFNPDRVGTDFYDWDLVTCINEIRKYIYGGLKEESLLRFIERNERISRFKGLMSFYPLVTSVKQFSELDGWLVSALRRAMKERAKVLNTKFGINMPPIDNHLIISGQWYQYHKAINLLETGAPSFVLAWRAARKAFRQYGLSDFEAPNYYSVFEAY